MSDDGSDYKDLSLDDAIEGEISVFDSDRQAFWTKDPKNDFYRIVDAASQLLLRGATDMSVPQPGDDDLLGWEAARYVAQDDFFAPEVLEGIELHVAYKFSTGVTERAQRCLTLTRLVMESRPSRPILRFLQRISRTYILDLKAECVIFCRAALENAVKDRFDRADIPMPDSNMSTRLKAAEKFGWMSPEGSREAREVWMRANKIIHDDPSIVSDPLPTIRSTMAALSELQS